MPIEFACPSCGKGYKVKDELAGKKAKCKCGSVMPIPEAAALPATEADPLGISPSQEDDPLGGDLFGDLPASSNTAPSGDSLFDEEFPDGGALPAAPTYNPMPQPQTNAYQAATPNAGAAPSGGAASYAVDVPTVGAIESVEETVTAMGSGGAWLVGIGLSGAGAFVGAVVWALITIFTGYEIGWIAIGVGFTSGFGMAIAHNISDDIDDFLGGVIASVMAIAGIAGGKFAVFLLIVMGGEEGFTFGMMFSPLDLLFFGLAVATAYRLGSGGGDDD